MSRGQRRRREAGVHRGTSKKDRVKGVEPYVYGLRGDRVVRDRKRAERQWARVRKRAAGLRAREIPIRRVSTGAQCGGRRQTRGDTRKDRQGRELVYKVATRWMSGTLSNPVYRKTQVNGLHAHPTRPGRLRCRNPKDHAVCRREARAAGVPTAGIVNSDCRRASRLTYPIPGNDGDRRPAARYVERVKERVKPVRRDGEAR